MNQHYMGNLLMVSNYPSDTAYAWWLMEHFWKIQAELFEQAGKKAFLAYPKITSISKTIANSPIVPIELTFPWYSRQDEENARKFIVDHNISYIYFTDQPFFNLKYAMMRRSGVKRIIIHDHTPGDRPPIRGLKGSIKSAINTIQCVTADYVFCVSDLMRKRNIETTRISSNKCVVVQNGIQPVICPKDNTKIIRESLGVEPTSILVATTGRAHPYKRFDFIIKCAHALHKRNPELDVIFLLVGDGPAMPELQDMVRRLNLENKVRLLGFRDDVHNLLCASDLALHAALGEGFSLSIIEYMSAGLPVLVPDIPSVSQATKHNYTGLIYPKDDAEAVATYIVALSTDSKRRITMGDAAKTCANNAYSLEKCTGDFLSAINVAYS